MNHKFQRGYINFGTTGDWLVIFGMAAGGTVAVTLGVEHGVKYMIEDKQEFRSRAQDAIEAKNLTVLSLAKFKRSGTCKDAFRPYAAAFSAKDADNKVVEGTACIAKDRETRLMIK